MKILIYIPTFNRKKSLFSQLDIISNEAELIQGDVHILINDNNSDEQISIDEYVSQNIFLKKNFSNIDGNANISLGFLYCKDYDYLWILSDNDIVKKGCLNVIKNEINANSNFDLLVFDYNASSISNITVKSDSNFNLLNSGTLDLISNTIYSTKAIANHIKSAFYFHNSSYPHLAVILSKLKFDKSINIKIIPRILVHSHDTKNSESSSFNFAIAGKPILLELMEEKPAINYAIEWTKKWGVSFFYNYKNFPLNSPLSLYNLKKINSLKLKFFLLINYLYVFLYRKLVFLIKDILPKKLISFLSKLAAKYLGLIH